MTHPKRGNAGPRSIVWGGHSYPPNPWIGMPPPNAHLAEARVSDYRRSNFDSIHTPPHPKASICQKSRSPSATARESTRRNSPRKTSDASAELFTRDPSLIPSRQRVQSVHPAARKNFLRCARCLSFPHCASEHRVPRQFCGNATRTAPHAPLALQLHIRHLTGQKLRA